MEIIFFALSKIKCFHLLNKGIKGSNGDLKYRVETK